MTLFIQDWRNIQQAAMRKLHNLDMTYQGIAFEDAAPQLAHQLNTLTMQDFGRFVEQHGIKPARRANPRT